MQPISAHRTALGTVVGPAMFRVTGESEVDRGIQSLISSADHAGADIPIAKRWSKLKLPYDFQAAVSDLLTSFH